MAVNGIEGLVACSPVYETDPVGGPDSQGAYLNMVVELQTSATAHELLRLCRQLEGFAGRVRRERWGPRTLDVDVLWIDHEKVDEPDLHVPHLRMFERPFVLAPLSHLAPDIVSDNWADDFDHAGVRVIGELTDL